MITKKHIVSFASACTLLLIGGCSSDEPFRWNGKEIPDDQAIIAFTANNFSALSLGSETGTRAENQAKMVLDSRSDLGTEVYLYQFDKIDDGTGVLLEDPLKLTVSEFTLSNGIYSKTIQRSKLKNGAVGYLVANPGSVISATKGATTEADFTKAVLSYDELQSGSGKIPSVSDPVIISLDSQTGVGVYELHRPYTRVKVTFNSTEANLLLTGAGLYEAPAQASYWSKGETKPTQNPNWKKLDDENGYSLSVTPYSASGNNTTNGSESSLSGYNALDNQGHDVTLKYVKKGDWLAADYLPIAKNDDDPMLIVKGYYATGEMEVGATRRYTFDGADEVYYAAKLGRDLKPNVSYNVTITKVAAKGQATVEDAVKSPSSVTVQITEETPTITSIISDGRNVLAVEETPLIAADGKGTMTILIRNEKEKLTESNISKYLKLDTDEDWVRKDKIKADFEDVAANPDDTGATSLYEQKITLKFDAENNLVEREADLTVTLYPNGDALSTTVADSDKRKLVRTVTLTQSGAADASLYDIFDIHLTAKRGSETILGLDNVDYLAYIGQAQQAAACEGLEKEDNGGKSRNEGLHWPMPNGDVTYTYTLKLKGGYSLQSGTSPNWGKASNHVNESDGTWTISLSSNDPEFTGDPYQNWSGPETISFPITKGEQTTTITLDLYHTGFFHQNNYYEVVTVNNQHWLDRNLGAISGGMMELGTDLGDTWPARSGSAGNRYDKNTAEAAMPTGWSVPTASDLMGLTSSPSFYNNSEMIGDGQCFASRMVYEYNIEGEAAKRSASSYFPHNQIMDGSNPNPEGQPGSAFYLTKTPAGAANWYQMVVINGASIYTRNMEIDNRRKASVRPIATSSSGAGSATTYKCSAKGFTHVYLYAVDDQGNRSYVNAWPGEVIATYDVADSRFHPFSFTSYVKYTTIKPSTDGSEVKDPLTGGTSTLMVIFNKVRPDTGEIEYSSAGANVTPNSTGMIFHNEWGYCGLTDDADHHRWYHNGHSCTSSNVDQGIYLVGEKPGWGGNNSSYKFTKGAGQEYYLSLSELSGIFKVWNSSESGNKYFGIHDTPVKVGVTYTLTNAEYQGDEGYYNMSLQAGTLTNITLHFNAETKEFWITSEGGGGNTGDVKDIYLIGDPAGGVWDNTNDAYKFTKQSDGIYTLFISSISGYFKLKYDDELYGNGGTNDNLTLKSDGTKYILGANSGNGGALYLPNAATNATLHYDPDSKEFWITR